jgi:heavy metal sensor kinase
MSLSLRARLLAGIVGGMILLLTIFSILLYIVIRSTLVDQFDTSLASLAHVLAASVELDANEIELEFDVKRMQEFLNPDKPTHYQLWLADGTVIAKSPLLGTDSLPRIQGSLNEIAYSSSQDKNSRPLKAAGLTFMPRIADNEDEDIHTEGYKPPVNAQPINLVVARDASDLYRQLGFLKWLLTNASIVVIVLSVVVAALVVSKGLQPLNSIAAEIAAVKEDNLTARIVTKNIPKEVIPIKNRLNELLFRLEASFNRERQFNADVAHELRTPLSGLLSTIEVTLTRNRDNEKYKKVLFDCHAIVENMQKMVANLLMLARLDAKQISFQTEQIQLAELMNSCWRPLSDKAIERKIEFDNKIKPEITCDSDRQNLSIIFSNILANAVEYSDEGCHVRATALNKDGTVEVAVSNTGCKLNTEQVSYVFDSFWRADSSRSDTGSHCGLGLALVQKLVKALGGNASAELHKGGIFIMRIILPS